MKKYNIKFSCYTHIGKCRSMNQDNFVCDGICRRQENDTLNYPINGIVPVSTRPVFGIFDGMGGQMCGEVAAYIAAESATHIHNVNNPIITLQTFCREANERICAYAKSHEISSMGTTAAILLFTANEVIVCNIGDSKIYCYSKEKMVQISEDHVIFQVSGKKSPLSQNLGIPEEEMQIEPYIVSGNVNDEDVFLISSDGLTDMVTEEKIKELMKNSQFEEIAGKLIKEALENGGRDNITVIVCKIEKEKNFFEKTFGERFKWERK